MALSICTHEQYFYGLLVKSLATALYHSEIFVVGNIHNSNTYAPKVYAA